MDVRGHAPLPLAVAGCGRLAREVILPLLGSMPGVQVTAVADPDPAALKAASLLAPHARTFQDWRDLTGCTGVKAIVVALPPALHAEAACATIRAGRALYLEKPMAVSADGARQVVAAHASGNVPVMVGFNYRFNPLVEAIRREVRRGAIGAPLLMRTVLSTGSVPGRSWRARRESGGGVLLDLASHHVDLVRHLLDAEIVRVCARVVNGRDGAQTAMLALDTSIGTLVSAVFATGAVEDDRIEVAGSLGQVAVDRYRSLAPRSRGVRVPGRLHGLADLVRASRHVTHAWRKRRSPWHEPSYRRALQHFLDAVRHGRSPSPGVADGWAALATILAAERAARTGAGVVPEPHVAAPGVPGHGTPPDER